ncbi:hypothetical protein PROSTU_02246 [Providencia stuartii ATCC 25827]|uniref:Uncharacterized protein n=1 Tax=Providencia stuartii ATCC 25827 TaxID=471874 RepID=A0AA86YIN9_PROST|nr:hypothetical protein PROSTU_02246 [Providencia stuartii ATCC 25827]
MTSEKLSLYISAMIITIQSAPVSLMLTFYPIYLIVGLLNIHSRFDWFN